MYVRVTVKFSTTRMQVSKYIFIAFIAMQLLLLQNTSLVDGKEPTDKLHDDRDEPMRRKSLDPLHKLSRHRRYLEFPRGCSLQCVLNTRVAVVDTVNYITLSFTLAFAWALPSEPPSELLEHIKDRLKDNIGQPPTEQTQESDDPLMAGTLGIERTDTPSRVTYIDINGSTKGIHGPTGQTLRIPTSQYYNVVQKTYPHYWGTMQSTKHNPFHQYTQTTKHLEYPWWRLRNPMREADRTPPPPLQQRYHRIFPILGKRTGRMLNETHSRPRRNGIADGHTSTVESLHIRYQRTTRHDLYETLEKYLDKRKMNGHYCILRALCETGQKTEEREPGSFVAELMRAMFTLPEPLADQRLGVKEQTYDAAHALEGDCADHYRQCQHSLWTSSFVY